MFFSLLPAIFFELPITRNFFISLEGSSYRESTVVKRETLKLTVLTKDRYQKLFPVRFPKFGGFSSCRFKVVTNFKALFSFTKM